MFDAVGNREIMACDFKRDDRHFTVALIGFGLMFNLGLICLGYLTNQPFTIFDLYIALSSFFLIAVLIKVRNFTSANNKDVKKGVELFHSYADYHINNIKTPIKVDEQKLILELIGLNGQKFNRLNNTNKNKVLYAIHNNLYKPAWLFKKEGFTAMSHANSIADIQKIAGTNVFCKTINVPARMVFRYSSLATETT